MLCAVPRSSPRLGTNPQHSAERLPSLHAPQVPTQATAMTLNTRMQRQKCNWRGREVHCLAGSAPRQTVLCSHGTATHMQQHSSQPHWNHSS